MGRCVATTKAGRPCWGYETTVVGGLRVCEFHIEYAMRLWRQVESRLPEQVAVYVMCGGGLLGKMASEQPADFYIDGRVGRLPYNRKAITQAVEVLRVHAEKEGFDPRNLAGVAFHNYGTF